MTPLFSRRVIESCVCAAHSSEYIVNRQVTREDHETAIQGSESGEMQSRTVIAIVGAIACFALLLLGFWLIARKPQSFPGPVVTAPMIPHNRVGGVVTSADGFVYGEPGVLPILATLQFKHLLPSILPIQGYRTQPLRSRILP
ncbi:hypothetical protein BKA82DRAFT_1004431 [Pisolithus tinctorius]|uniref:Uncharacterized protein n=1 Tax=Pisolithus tinctorius Marx 270 TaxID=870435 RepID=A0A0C3NWY7_PISTI|nr:hypothetical protein BKA82DRAFT_1004431 [Pisolithus tinctorius]KIN99708.1 hypothetical protein M404DRAFT_1004431 [Pisolithus tinctorius Marx 270]